MSTIFYQIFIFQQMIAFQKCFLFHLKSSFHSRDIQIFVFLSSPFLLPVSPCFRGCSKINLKVYDIINCVNKNLITHFICYLEKEKNCDNETLSIDGKGTFLWESHVENVPQKLVPDLILILVNNSKQPLHEWNYFKNKIFWKRIIKKP